MTQPKNPSRRRLFGAMGAGGLVAAIPIRVIAADAPAVRQPPPSPVPATRTFLNAREARFVDAAIARLIPRDELGPGALEAGVADYIDGQLAGAWGAGERLYRSGPWREGTPSQGYQLPYTPAELFRKTLRELDVEGFASANASQQDVWLKKLEKSHQEFFETLLALTIEGFFGDPAYGGNRDMAGWKLIGFPGAYSNYYDLVDHYGYAFTSPPVALSEAPPGHGGHAHGAPRDGRRR